MPSILPIRRRKLLSIVTITTWTVDPGRASRWFSTVTAQPNDVFINEKLGARRETLATTLVDEDWFWNSGNSRLYVENSVGDPDTVPTVVKTYTQ